MKGGMMKYNKAFFALCVACSTVLSVIMVTIIFIVYMNFISSDNNITIVYADASEAQKKDALAHRMVPGFLPKSATQIIATGNLNTNHMRIEFSYSEDFTDFLERQKTSNVPKTMSIPKPKRSKIDMSDMDSLIYIRCTDAEQENSKGSLIVNAKQKRALFIFPALDRCACPTPWEVP
jgi:hypothetical protein